MNLETLGIIITSATSVASIVIAVCTLRQNNKMIEESARPYISVYTEQLDIVVGDVYLYLVIKNFGSSGAIVNEISVRPSLEGCYRMPTDKDYILDLKNCMLSPNQSKKLLLDYNNVPNELQVKISYTSTAGRHYVETTKINPKAGIGLPNVKAHNENKELKIISSVLQEMLKKDL